MLGAVSIVGLGVALAAGQVAAEPMQPVEEFEREATLEELTEAAEELARRAEEARRALEEAREGDIGPALAARAPAGLGPRIVNGVLTASFPTAGALLRGNDPDSAGSWCSGTLIGCETFLTAAHCVADDPTPANYKVFLQHGGVFDAASITRHPDYDFPDNDVAVVKLGEPVSGIAPTAINQIDTPPSGTPGIIVGFGRSGGFNQDYGLKRSGQVATASCTGGLSNATLVCWDFNAPVGPPGEDSNTCNADSGGPLFVNLGPGIAVAGVTSGGSRSDCLASDHSYDANVFTYRVWIESVAGKDLFSHACGDLPPVTIDAGGDGSGARVQAASGVLGFRQPEQLFELDVPPGATLLRVAMNAVDDGLADFNLFVREGSPPTATEHDCAQDGSGQYAFCEFESPGEGPWHILVRQASGEGPFQVTATTFR